MKTIMKTKPGICCAVLGLIFGGATLPPRVAIENFRTVSGVWAGHVSTQNNTTSVRTVFGEDGTYTWTTPNDKGTGTMKLSDGKMKLESSSGRVSIASLHEGPAGRLLRLEYVGMDASGELRPAK